MSGGFGDREKALEGKWAHDEELRFKVMARRNRLLGEWAARELGLNGPRMEEYAKSIVQADLAGPGQHDVLKKIRGDFDTAKVAQSDHVIRRKMEELLVIAGEQIVAASKK